MFSMVTLLADGSSLSGALASLATLLAVGGGLIAGIVAWRGATRATSRAKNVPSQKTLEDRLDELSKSMRQSARLVEEVSAELEARAATARRLNEEAETAKALAELHREQADAVRRMLDVELTTTARGIRRDSIVIGLASFVAGGGVSFAVTLLVHPLH